MSSARSGTVTAAPDWYASRHGPCPTSVCSCSKRSAAELDAATYCGAKPGEINVTPDAGDRQQVDDPLDEVVEDPLDRELGDQCPGELAQHRRELAFLNHVAPSARQT